jgi:hypothetical protein
MKVMKMISKKQNIANKDFEPDEQSRLIPEKNKKKHFIQLPSILNQFRMKLTKAIGNMKNRTNHESAHDEEP